MKLVNKLKVLPSHGLFLLVSSDKKMYISQGDYFKEFSGPADIKNETFASNIPELLRQEWITMNDVEDASYMLMGSNVTEFKFDMNKVTDASDMCNKCVSLTTFKSKMPLLKEAKFMFFFSGIKLFENDLLSLTSAPWMFHGCSSLTTVKCKAPNIIDATMMFYKCPNLTNFYVDFGNLKFAEDIFKKSHPSLQDKLPNVDKTSDDEEDNFN